MRLTLKERVENCHDDGIWTASWTPAETLISGSVDETVKVWSPGESIESQHTYTDDKAIPPTHRCVVGHTLGVISVAVSSSGEYAASSALDSFIRVWNLADASTKAVMETPPSETWQLAWHPTADSLLLAAAGGSAHSIVVWDCDTASKKQELAVPWTDDKIKKDKFVLSVAYSPDGKRIACGTASGRVCIFDCQSGTLLHSLEGHYKPVRSVTFTPDSDMLLTGCDDMHSHLYDVESGSLIEAFSGHGSWVLSVACHPSGAAFATGSSDSKVKLWDVQTRSCAQTIIDHTDQVWQVTFNKDGSQMASVSDDKSISFFTYSA